MTSVPDFRTCQGDTPARPVLGQHDALRCTAADHAAQAAGHFLDTGIPMPQQQAFHPMDPPGWAVAARTLQLQPPAAVDSQRTGQDVGTQAGWRAVVGHGGGP